MRNKRISVAILIILLSALVVVFAGCSAAQDPSSQEAETKKTVDSFIQAYNTGDADACIALLDREIVTELKAGAQNVKSQDEKSVHETIRANIAMNHKWEILEYITNAQTSITIRISETGDDLKLAGVDSINSEVTFEVIDGKITTMTTTIDKATADQMAAKTAGGIGIGTETQPDRILIIGVAPNSPAEKAGLKAADEIMAIDGINCSEMKQGEQIIRIRGPIDSKVVLTINRPGDQKTFDVEIVRVDISTFSTE
jgi:C-terminal processing protease CtpA/Prc